MLCDTYFASLEYMIPNRGSTKIDVKVCVAALNTHETISMADRVKIIQRNHNELEQNRLTSTKKGEKYSSTSRNPSCISLKTTARNPTKEHYSIENCSQ